MSDDLRHPKLRLERLKEEIWSGAICDKSAHKSRQSEMLDEMEKMLLRLRPYRLDEMEEDDFNYEGWTTDIRYGPDGEIFEAIDKNSHHKA